ncbi:unnamed protein product [Adineta steineri]|uniref:TIR domain-containing protein n=1 Tax=Adineta steineri TaxID=433720 RepID=A0A815FW61_9BILA|nr:unnamed protein product [Adineta steineri]
MHVLATICHELASLNTFRLFDYSMLRNHGIFICIARTFEMLLTKSNHIQTIPMTTQEEDCFYATSYLIAQLCLYQNKPVGLFYGKVSSVVFPVTEKPNPRDQNIDQTDKKSDEITAKPNLKTARLPASAPKARPIEQTQTDITKILKIRKFPSQFISVSYKTPTDLQSSSERNSIEISVRKYKDLFLTKLFFEQLTRAIEDLACYDYSSHHIKYKVIDRLVRLCSKLNTVDVLLSSIMKCLCSKFYCDILLGMKLNQIRLTPKQLFFIYECPQFIIQHNFPQKDVLICTLSQTFAEITKPIFDKHLLRTARENAIKSRFLTESFLERLTQDIIELSTKEYQPNVLKYKDAVRRVRVCAKLETNDVESLLNPIIDCLLSEYYINVYKQIHLNQSKGDSKTTQINGSLAYRHLFFMRECPEFLMRHDYKRQNEIRPSLSKTMLSRTAIIFAEYLPYVLSGADNSEYKNARLEALTCHIKLLNHFALTPSIRQDFLSTEIINQVLLVLQDQTLVDDVERIPDVNIGMVRQCLTFLYNLSFNTRILIIMRTNNVLQICHKMRLVNDQIIQFASQTLAVMLDANTVDRIVEPQSLTKIYIEYMNKSTKEPRQPYQGVKLNCILRNLQKIIENDEVREYTVEGKEGIPSLSKCVCVGWMDSSTSILLKQIQRSSLDIVWKILYYEPKSNIQFKSIDQLIDHLLSLLDNPSKKIRQNAKHIIWRLGDEKDFLSEQTKKVKAKGEKNNEEEAFEIDNQLTTKDQWDDSVPFDVMVSFSNDVNIKNLCNRIYNRLIAANIKVYIEEQGQHRLELMKKAIEKNKIILVCLSTNYRASKVCMEEVEYAFKKKCPIIPVIVEANFLHSFSYLASTQ